MDAKIYVPLLQYLQLRNNIHAGKQKEGELQVYIFKFKKIPKKNRIDKSFFRSKKVERCFPQFSGTLLIEALGFDFQRMAQQLPTARTIIIRYSAVNPTAKSAEIYGCDRTSICARISRRGLSGF